MFYFLISTVVINIMIAVKVVIRVVAVDIDVLFRCFTDGIDNFLAFVTISVIVFSLFNHCRRHFCGLSLPRYHHYCSP